MKKFFVLFACIVATAGAARADIMSKDATVKALAKKQDTLTADNVKTTGTGSVVTAVAADAGTVTVTKAEVQIPVGGQTASEHAPIWIQ